MLRLAWTTTPPDTAALRRLPGTLAERAAPRLQAELQAAAPWQDRTGNARRGLRVRVQHGQASASLLLVHGVSYGAALELGHAGRYATIGPLINRVTWDDLRG